MDRDEIIERLLALAADGPAEALRERAIAPVDEALYFDALEVFGGWEGALVHALSAAAPRARHPRTSRAGAAASAAGVVDVAAAVADREAHGGAHRPVLVITSERFILWFPGDVFTGALEPAAAQPLRGWPEGMGVPTRIFDPGDLNAVLALSDDGRVFGWDARIVPNLGEDDEIRRLGVQSGVRGWITAFDRTPLRRDGLAVTVTAAGKIKVTQNRIFPQPVTSEGTEACVVDDGDRLVDAYLATRSDRILLAASNGYAIVFALRDVRPQGRKATGVRGIGLRDGAQVVGSLLVAEAPEVALVTAQGFAKRMDVRDFRPQSRAGLGLVAAKLNRDDQVTAVAGCGPATDLLLLTNRGRALRLPAEAVPVQGRSTRGSRVIDLDEGELVTGLTRLLPQAFVAPEASPQTSEE